MTCLGTLPKSSSLLMHLLKQVAPCLVKIILVEGKKKKKKKRRSVGFCPDFGFCPVGLCSACGLLSGGFSSPYSAKYIQRKKKKRLFFNLGNKPNFFSLSDTVSPRSFSLCMISYSIRSVVLDPFTQLVMTLTL